MPTLNSATFILVLLVNYAYAKLSHWIFVLLMNCAYAKFCHM